MLHTRDKKEVLDYLVKKYGPACYNYEIGAYKGQIPFVPFVKDVFRVTHDKVNATAETLKEFFGVKVAPSVELRYSGAGQEFANEIDNEIISRHKFFNGDALYINGARMTEGKLVLDLKKTKYYAAVSRFLALEEETFKRGIKNLSTPLRQKELPDVKNIFNQINGEKRPYAIGGTAVVVLNTKDGWKIVMHQRSVKVSTAKGYFSTIPSYGLSVPREDNCWDEINIVKYNIQKEFAEEIFGVEEDNTLEFTKKSSFKKLMTALKDNKVEMYCLGLGLNLLNGVFDLTYAIIVNDQTYAGELLSKYAPDGIKATEEGGRQTMSLSDEGGMPFTAPLIVDIVGGDPIGDALANGNFHYVSVFTLAETIKLMIKLDKIRASWTKLGTSAV